MLKTNKQIKKTIFTAVFAVFMIPTLVSADHTGSYGSDSYDYGGWGGNAPTYDYSYTPNYSYTGGSSYTPSYTGGSSYTPSYSGGSNYYTPSYSGGSNYYTPSYSGGSSYTPSYVSPSTNSYTSSANYNRNRNTNRNNNANNNANNNTNSNSNHLNNNNDIDVDTNVNSTNTNTSGSNSTSSSNQNQGQNQNQNANSNSNSGATSTSGSNSNATGGNSTSSSTGGNSTSGSNATGGAGGAGGNSTSSTGASTSGANATGGAGGSSTSTTGASNAVNNNVNNIYVYANPTGTAVAYNPQHQYLNVYCVITPNNPRIGQSVTATAYATGGIGGYTYTWGGAASQYQMTGPSTTFTSYTAGTKTITVTARSGEEIITKSCDVTFVNENVDNNNLSAICYANPTNGTVNQTIAWTAVPNSGNGSYSYNWSGTDGLNGNGQSVSRQYGYTGNKTAYVTVYSNGQSVTANCSTNINNYAGAIYTNPNYYTNSSVNLTPNITSGTPVSGVYLSQLPATGLSLGFVEYMVGAMVIVLATVFTFIYQARKRLMLENI